ncbi:MAG TPA: ATP-binding protein, partial [Thermoanaerobaculia bacterium]|nr:ATP-binding protein [Thermoanaerobaculia bacterium]
MLKRLSGEFVGRVDLQSYFWEHEPMRATRDFQDQIPPPSTFDVVLCILWSRLGSRLHAKHNRADGTPYLSGTEYEFEDAAAAALRHGVPRLLVYFNKTSKTIPAEPVEVRQQMSAQFDALRAFEKRWFIDHAENTLKAAFHTYTDLGRFEEMVETHLRRLLTDHLAQDDGSGGTTSVPIWTAGSPFRGLEPFEFEHEAIFFGRTRAIGEILEALRKQAMEGSAFVLVLGMSGCGKSSLVKAGALPLLTRPGVVEGIGLWRRAIFRPADAVGDLFDGLATSLLRAEALPELASDGTPKEQLAQLLRKAPESVIALIKGGLSQAAREVELQENLVAQPAARLALVIDQLEEIFTIEAITRQQRADFIAVLAALARSGRVFVLATLRSDFYARCADEPQLIELKGGSGTYHLLPPSALEICQIVRQPAFAAGLHFEQNPETQERLDDLIRDAAVRDPQALPLLQFTLQALYDRRKVNGCMTLEAYHALGGVEGAVAARAEQTYGRLSDSAKESFPAVARALVRVGEGAQAVRQRAAMSQLEADAAACELIAA